MTRQPIYNVYAFIIISLKPKLMHYVFFRHLVINKYKCVLWIQKSLLLVFSHHGALLMPAKTFCFVKRIKKNIYITGHRFLFKNLSSLVFTFSNAMHRLFSSQWIWLIMSWTWIMIFTESDNFLLVTDLLFLYNYQINAQIYCYILYIHTYVIFRHLVLYQ